MSIGQRNLSYAQGWIYESRAQGPVIWHNGASYSMDSIVVLYPSANVGLLVLTNMEVNQVPALLQDRLYSLLFPAAPAPTSAVAAAAGTYLVARRSAPIRVAAADREVLLRQGWLVREDRPVS